MVEQDGWLDVCTTYGHRRLVCDGKGSGLKPTSCNI